MNRNGAAIRFTWPWLTGLILLTLIPLAASLLLSFTRWDGFSERDIEWVGLQHYRELLDSALPATVPSDGASPDGAPLAARLPVSSNTKNNTGGQAASGTPPASSAPRHPRFLKAVYNTVVFAACAAPLGVVAALLLAVLLNQQIKGIAIFRCAYYLPHILGGVGTILIWQWLFNPDVGLINVTLQWAHGGWAWLAGLLGLEVAAWAPPRWLHSPQWCKPALVLMHLWGSGGAMLIILAALQNVPERLYEAARLDGAGRWRRFRHVTLPQISPVILFNFVVGLIGAVRVFRPAYLLRHWSQDDGLLFYMVYLYENAFEDPARLGFASALTWILFVVLFVLTLLTVAISRRWVHYED